MKKHTHCLYCHGILPKGRGTYCSLGCQHSYYKATDYLHNRKLPGSPLEALNALRKCKECGSEVARHRGNSKYCSQTCADKKYAERLEIQRQERMKGKKFKCICCGTLYDRIEGNPDGPYCSRDCYQKHKPEHRTASTQGPADVLPSLPPPTEAELERMEYGRGRILPLSLQVAELFEMASHYRGCRCSADKFLIPSGD